MASTSETGHAKNIATFKALIEADKGFGVAYNPSNPLLITATMETQYDACNTAQTNVNAESGLFKPIVNARQIVFKDVKTLARRVRSASKSCGGSKEWMKNVDTVVTKILGERAEKAVVTAKDPAGTSASQQSFDNTVNNFQLMVDILKNEVLYVPNEAELSVSGLDGKHTNMHKANNAVKAGVVPYNSAIIIRNRALYTETTGLCDVGQASKDYVRSAFGFSTSEFKLVSKFKFTKLAKV